MTEICLSLPGRLIEIPIPNYTELEPYYWETGLISSTAHAADYLIDYNLFYQWSKRNWELTVHWFAWKYFSLDIKYTKKLNERYAYAFGIDNITYSTYISSVGAGGYVDDQYVNRRAELLSFYGVFSYDWVEKYTKFYCGLGRGKFVGYGPHSHWFAIDGLWAQLTGEDYNTYCWSGALGEVFAIALFTGFTWQIFGDNAFLLFELSGRNVNAGFKYIGNKFTILCGFEKLEHFWSMIEYAIKGSVESIEYEKLAPRAFFYIGYHLPTALPRMPFVSPTKPVGVVRGKILARKTKRPISAPKISIIPADACGAFQLLRDGSYIAFLTKRICQIKVEANGYHPESKTIEVEKDTVVVNFLLDEAPRYTITSEEERRVVTGRIVDARTRKPVAGVKIKLVPQDAYKSFQLFNDGSYRLILSRPQCVIRVEAKGYKPVEQPVKIGNAPTVVNFYLEPEK